MKGKPLLLNKEKFHSFLGTHDTPERKFSLRKPAYTS